MSAQGNQNKPQQDGKDQVGKDTDNDGRVVQPGHKPGEVDGDKQRQKQQTQNR
jgi:hypothetical protein